MGDTASLYAFVHGQRFLRILDFGSGFSLGVELELQPSSNVWPFAVAIPSILVFW